ncbi:hypothetical protein [Lysinibacillus sp. 38-6]|uniref:hypothetical protein n=1 Tax=Lysinibacillus sp. 38-6 TaxID=3385991 RepID=UPI0039088888
MQGHERPDVWDEDGRDIDRWENDGGRSQGTRHGRVPVLYLNGALYIAGNEFHL